MGSEIAWSASLSGGKGGGAQIAMSGSGVADMVGSEYAFAVQTMSTTPAQIVLPGVDQAQAIAIKNLPFLADGTTPNTATVTVGLNTPPTQILSVLPPGRMALLWGISTTIHGVASAGTPDIAVAVFEN